MLILNSSQAYLSAARSSAYKEAIERRNSTPIEPQTEEEED